MKKYIGILLAVGLLVSVPAFSAGEQETDQEELVVAMELQYPPFEMSNEKGEPSGISVEIAEALGEYLDRPVHIQNTAWTGLIPSLQTGKADIIISSMTITSKRKEVVDFSIPYIRAGLTLLIAEDSPVENFHDLNEEGRVVAVKSGTTGALIAKEELPHAELHIFEEVSACVLEVTQGKADAFIYDALTVIRNHQNNPESTRVNLESIPGSFGDWGMAVKKGNDKLLEQVNDFIRTFREEGGFDELADTYLKEEQQLFDQQGIPFFFDVE
ncbi:MAG: transporter substrate-binding domain-containing protein [Spirochaetota bacterium]